MKEKALIVGATSAIAEAFARRLAARGAALYLAARNDRANEAIARDLVVRGAAHVSTGHFDARDTASHAGLVEDAWNALESVDVVVVAHGSLPDQPLVEQSAEEALAEVEVNVSGNVSVLTAVANRMERQGGGTVVVIGSVAGDRGRASNYVYGACKAFLETFVEGLGHRLSRSGARVLLVKPGFVDTPMTAAFDKSPLWARPEKIAADIESALRRRRTTLYTPWFWRWIMLLVRSLPTGLLHRTRL